MSAGGRPIALGGDPPSDPQPDPPPPEAPALIAVRAGRRPDEVALVVLPLPREDNR
jgi:hypothetical protein